jgi:hypothetical protein
VSRAFAARSSGFLSETAPRYLIPNRDGIYGIEVYRCLASLHIEEVLTALALPGNLT